MGKYDTGSKKVVNVYNQAWAEWVLQQQNIEGILRWEMPIVQESPIIQELLKQERQTWLKQGLEQGLEQGERKAALKALSQTLTIRFNIDIENFTEPLEKLTAASLQKLNEIALTVDAPAQFEEALASLVTEENPEHS